jgi:hypothetical protein
VDLNAAGAHDPTWWRKFQFAPVEQEPAAEPEPVKENAPASPALSAAEQAAKEAEDKAAKAAAEMKKTLLEPPLPQLWILSPGAALQARYNEGHTVRMQLSGTVRYTLFSSNMLHAMHLYPSYSGRVGQSQVPFYRTADHLENIRAKAE